MAVCVGDRVEITSLNSGVEIGVINLPSAATVRFSTDGHSLLVCDEMGTARMVRVDSGEKTRQWSSVRSGAALMAADRLEQWLVTGGQEQAVRRWRFLDGTPAGHEDTEAPVAELKLLEQQQLLVAKLTDQSAIMLKRPTLERIIRVHPQTPKTVTWWSEEPTSLSVQRTRIPIRLVSMVGIAMVSAGFGAWLYSSYSKTPNAAYSTLASTEPSVTGGDAAEPAQNVEEVSLDRQETATLLATIENVTDIASPAEASKPTELLGAERPTLLAESSNAETMEATPDNNPTRAAEPLDKGSIPPAPAAKPLESSADSSTTFSDLNRAALDEEETESVAALMDAKSEIDRLFDKTAAIIELHMRNTQAFQKGQTEWHEVTKSLADLQAFVSSGTIQIQTLTENQAALQLRINEYAYELKFSSTLQTTPILHQQVLHRFNEMSHEINLVTGRLRELRTVIPMRAQEIVKATERKRALEANFQLWANQEYESVRNLMDDIDFFGELPTAYHQRLVTHTSTLLASQPDFLLGYLLHGFSALQTGNAVDVEQDQRALQQQLSYLAPDISRLRSGLLNRYAAMSLTMLAASQAKTDRGKLALKTMKRATERDIKFVEGWLIRGSMLAASGVPVGANEFFQRAIKLQPEDPRVYRITAKELFDAKTKAVTPLRGYVQELVQHIGSSDWQSWAVASRVSAGLGDTDLAERYFSSITRTPINSNQVDELAAYLKQNTNR